jgi:hypothetical protein
MNSIWIATMLLPRKAAHALRLAGERNSRSWAIIVYCRTMILVPSRRFSGR